ncbi:hypothetical protein HHK36_000360 [Tetracentron sinense]|uniref:Bifunctional inhibitor/plant lipid transfer protein/seed storage helical domain-containing protein n=1 Tax=Tetracentron sinense TaxID=13715 RepID=A0A835DTX9_TETSI|nr:hypothetical protein HHK36_000360 [Tetracentron sinense]
MGCSEMILLMVAAAVGTLAAVEGQSSTPSCAMALVPCADYLNSTNPPESCCKPLKQTVETQLECLCNLYNNPGLFASLRINITQALALPKYCGVSGNLSACNNDSNELGGKFKILHRVPVFRVVYLRSDPVAQITD